MYKLTYYRNIILSVLSIILGVCIGYVQLTQENDGFPYKDDLSKREGFIDWVQKYDYGIRFGFVDDPYNFDYPSKSDGQGVVYDALVNSKGYKVSILFEPKETNKPIYTDKEFHNAFEVEVNGNIIRSFAESEKAWKSDNLLTPFIVALFIFGGIYVLRKTSKENKNA